MRKLLVASLLVLTVACATHVNMLSERRVDISTQARVLAIVTRNLEDLTEGRGGSAAQQAVEQDCATLHTAAEAFAGSAARWDSDDEVDTRYEQLIDAWVKVKRGIHLLPADRLTTESYNRVAHEWEQLALSTGYAGTAYENAAEKK